MALDRAPRRQPRVEQDLRREIQQLQEQLCDTKGAFGAQLHVVQQDKLLLEDALSASQAETAEMRAKAEAAVEKLEAVKLGAAKLRTMAEEMVVVTNSAAEEARRQAEYVEAKASCAVTEAELQKMKLRLRQPASGYRFVA